MGSEREFRERRSASVAGDFESARRRRKDGFHLNGFIGRRASSQHWSELWAGNRGASHLRWRCGPREPPSSGGDLHRGGKVGGSFSLFVDGLSKAFSNRFLQQLFGVYGKLLDTFISRKRKPNKKCLFGFVRYSHRREAEKAIADLNGCFRSGVRLSVSMAKYQKGGTPFKVKLVPMQSFYQPRKQTTFASPRDSRKFCEEVQSKNSTVGKKENIIPVLFNFRLSEKSDLALLKYVIVVENSEVLISEAAMASIKASELAVSGLSSKSPTKMIKASVQDAGNYQRHEDRVPGISIMADSQTTVSGAGIGVPKTNNIEYGAAHEKEVSLDPAVIGVPSDPLPAVNAGEVSCSSQPQMSATTLVFSTYSSPVKPKKISATGNRAKALNSRDVAKFLGFYGPIKDIDTQKRGPM
ncbi:unnamed protein product [Amaranthus hypochondriacus]